MKKSLLHLTHLNFLGQTKIQTIILRIFRRLKSPIQKSGAKTVTGGHLTNHPNTDMTLEIVRHPGNRHPSDTAAMRKRDPKWRERPRWKRPLRWTMDLSHQTPLQNLPGLINNSIFIFSELFVKDNWVARKRNKWPLIRRTFFVFSVSNPRNAFWADTAPFKGPELCLPLCF